jgi:hypothetical protein
MATATRNRRHGLSLAQLTHIEPHIAALGQRLDHLERWALRLIEPHQTLPTAVAIVAGSSARS